MFPSIPLKAHCCKVPLSMCCITYVTKSVTVLLVKFPKFRKFAKKCASILRKTPKMGKFWG